MKKIFKTGDKVFIRWDLNSNRRYGPYIVCCKIVKEYFDGLKPYKEVYYEVRAYLKIYGRNIYETVREKYLEKAKISVK